MIAAQIMIGLDGVRFHIKKIYDKLHVHSATEAISKAIKDPLVKGVLLQLMLLHYYVVKLAFTVNILA